MKDLFCAKCQAVTQHKGSVDQNGEFLFECQNWVDGGLDNDGNPTTVKCDRFMKFPANTTPQTFGEMVTKHEEGNIGQISIEGQEKTLSLLLEEITSDIASDAGSQE